MQEWLKESQHGEERSEAVERSGRDGSDEVVVKVSLHQVSRAMINMAEIIKQVVKSGQSVESAGGEGGE